MTVANAISEQFYLGDGVTTSFDFTYPVQAVTDLVVSVNGYAMTLGVDYSGVLLVGGASGARITFTAAPANGATVFLLRTPPVSQGFVFVAGMKLWEGTIGIILDKLTMLVAKLYRRSIVLSDTDPTTSPLVLPSKTARANMVLGFDASGNLATYIAGSVSSFTGIFSAVNTWLAQQIFKTASDAFTATANYSAGSTNARTLTVSGSFASPNTTQDAAAIVQKSTASIATSGVNSASYVSIFKKMTGANTRASAIFTEAQDTVGGAGSWVEGIKTLATITGGTLGSAYGAVLSAGLGSGISYTYLVGAEATTENYSGVDSPIYAALNLNQFSAAFVATNITGGVGSKSDAAFFTNPYSGAPFRTGFAVYGDDGGGRKGVDHTGFAVKGALVHGLDLYGGGASYSGSAIRLPNLGIVRARNAANNYDHNVLYYDGANQLVIGLDAAQVVFGVQIYAPAAVVAGLATVQALSLSAPVTKTANYTTDSGAAKDSTIIFNGAASLTLTLPAPATYPGRRIRVKTIAAFTVVSASSNVVPLTGGAAGTAILAATAGKWADLDSDGTNWVITAGN